MSTKINNMFTQIGICVKDLSNNQLSYLLHKQAGIYSAKDYTLDVIVFYQNHAPMFANPAFGVLPIVELWGYRGIAIATCLDTADKTINSIGPTRKYFYVWDLEWTRNKPHNYSCLARIYQNPNIELLARSDEHANIISKCWNRQVYAVMGDFNFSQLVKIIKHD